MNVLETALKISDDLKATLSSIDAGQAEALTDLIIQSKRIFAAGAGRSLLMIRGLAMRLMHLGFTAYVVGETVTPSIGEGDLLIIGSGSGETATLAVIAGKAKKAGAKLALITSRPDSTIGKTADQLAVLTPKGIQLGGSAFEQGLLIFCDAIVARLVEKCDIPESGALLWKNHANLE